MGTPRKSAVRAATRPDEKYGVSYTRYSTVEQGSTAEQQAINEEVASENDVSIAASFHDEGISRSLSERPGLREVFRYLETNDHVRYLVVNELERLTAGVDQRQQITTLCKRLGITIVTEDIGMIDPHDEDKMHEADERAVRAKGEVLKIRRRTKRSIRARVKSGKSVAMRPPYGVRMKPLVTEDGVVLPSGVSMIDGQGRRVSSGKLELHPDEHPWLVKIFDWAYEGHGNEEIARRLFQEGVPTKMGRKQWRATTIQGIVENPFYKGVMIWGLQEIRRDENGNVFSEVRKEGDPGRLTLESPLGAIIDPKKWDAIQEQRKERYAHLQHSVRQRQPQQVFDGRVFCARCGHKMYGRNVANSAAKKKGRLYWRYVCPSRRIGWTKVDGFTPKCQTAHGISLREILEALAQVDGGAAITVVHEGSDENVDATRRREQVRLEKAQSEIDRVTDLAIEGLVSKEKLRATREDCEQRIADAQAILDSLANRREPEVERLTGKTANTLKELAELLADEDLPLEHRIEALDDLGVIRIDVDMPNLRLQLRD